MSEFLKGYLDMGLRDIVSIEYDSHEEAGGYQEENTQETVVAKKGTKHVSLSVHLRKKFSPNSSGPEFGVTSEKAITKAQYDALVNGKEVMDRPDVLQQMAASDEHQKKVKDAAQDLEQKISATAPKCPKCHGTTKKRLGKYGSFWSCSTYPKCDGTAKLSGAAAKLQDQLSNLYKS